MKSFAVQEFRSRQKSAREFDSMNMNTDNMMTDTSDFSVTSPSADRLVELDCYDEFALASRRRHAVMTAAGSLDWLMDDVLLFPPSPLCAVDDDEDEEDDEEYEDDEYEDEDETTRKKTTTSKS